MSDSTKPAALLSEPAILAVRTLNADQTINAYLAIAVSAVKARDEEVQNALAHLIRCPALDVGTADAEAVRAGIALAQRLLYPGAPEPAGG